MYGNNDNYNNGLHSHRGISLETFSGYGDVNTIKNKNRLWQKVKPNCSKSLSEQTKKMSSDTIMDDGSFYSLAVQ